MGFDRRWRDVRTKNFQRDRNLWELSRVWEGETERERRIASPLLLSLPLLMRRSLCLLSTRITSTSNLSPRTHLNRNLRQVSTCRPTLSSKIVTIPHPSGMSSKSAHIIKSYPLDDKDAKWVSLRAIEWKDQEGKERKWECADRRTRKGEADGQ